eukprot:354060-Chlamydomonas_euryale.AAC.9
MTHKQCQTTCRSGHGQSFRRLKVELQMSRMSLRHSGSYIYLHPAADKLQPSHESVYFSSSHLSTRLPCVGPIQFQDDANIHKSHQRYMLWRRRGGGGGRAGSLGSNADAAWTSRDRTHAYAILLAFSVVELVHR